MQPKRHDMSDLEKERILVDYDCQLAVAQITSRPWQTVKDFLLKYEAEGTHEICLDLGAQKYVSTTTGFLCGKKSEKLKSLGMISPLYLSVSTNQQE